VIGIGVKLAMPMASLPFFRDRLGQALQRLAGEPPRLGRAKADRARDARPHRRSFMAPARRQVKHVARLEQPLVARHEPGEHLQWHVAAQARSRDAADAPASPSLRLQQEDIV